jgi:hypothetical protein
MKTLLRSVIVVAAVSSIAFAQQPAPAQQGASGAQEPSGPARAGAPRTPPPEAVAACSGRSAGASCTFQHKDRTETGSCFTPDPSLPIACKPVRAPRDEAPAASR